MVLSALSTPAATQAATFAASSADYSYLTTTINGESYDSAHSVFTVSSADGYAYPAVAAAFAAMVTPTLLLLPPLPHKRFLPPAIT